MVSAEGTKSVDVQLVRLIHGDETPEGPGFIETEFDAPINGAHAVEKQFTQAGNFATVESGDDRRDAFSSLRA